MLELREHALSKDFHQRQTGSFDAMFRDSSASGARSRSTAVASEYTCLGFGDPYAEVAQLVEHNLAKVGVAGSSPVFRSVGSSATLRYSLQLFAISFADLAIPLAGLADGRFSERLELPALLLIVLT